MQNTRRLFQLGSNLLLAAFLALALDRLFPLPLAPQYSPLVLAAMALCCTPTSTPPKSGG
jgi:hypothetical protein